MSSFAVLIGPIIITLIVAALLAGLGIWAARAYVKALAANRAASQAVGERAKIPPILFHHQGEVIDAVIGELESRPATYETFPEDIRNALYAAHEKARDLERQLSQ